jgi:hypothetical protein
MSVPPLSLVLCHGGALILLRTLGLSHGLAIGEDRPDHLLAGGMVRGDVQELMGGARLSIAELVNEGLAGGPSQVCANDIYIDDVRQRVALPGKPVDVVPQGFARLLLAALVVSRVFGVHVHPLEVPNENLLDLRPTMNVVGQQEFVPCPNVPPTQMGRYWMMK